MPLEDVWWEFFSWRADPALYSIYAHPAPGFKFPNGSLFSGREIGNLSKDLIEVQLIQLHTTRRSQPDAGFLGRVLAGDGHAQPSLCSAAGPAE